MLFMALADSEDSAFQETYDVIFWCLLLDSEPTVRGAACQVPMGPALLFMQFAILHRRNGELLSFASRVPWDLSVITKNHAEPYNLMDSEHMACERGC